MSTTPDLDEIFIEPADIANRNSCSLSKLPAELREAVYKLLFQGSTLTINFTRKNIIKRAYNVEYHPSCHSNLFLAYVGFKNEATEVFWKETRVIASSPTRPHPRSYSTGTTTSLEDFAQAVPSSIVTRIQHLRNIDLSGKEPVADTIAKFPSLNTIVFSQSLSLGIRACSPEFSSRLRRQIKVPWDISSYEYEHTFIPSWAEDKFLRFICCDMSKLQGEHCQGYYYEPRAYWERLHGLKDVLDAGKIQWVGTMYVDQYGSWEGKHHVKVNTQVRKTVHIGNSWPPHILQHVLTFNWEQKFWCHFNSNIVFSTGSGKLGERGSNNLDEEQIVSDLVSKGEVYLKRHEAAVTGPDPTELVLAAKCNAGCDGCRVAKKIIKWWSSVR